MNAPDQPLPGSVPAPRPRTFADAFGSVEYAIGAVFTLIIICFHFEFVIHAGGLWRDEANTVGLVTLPTWSEVWQHLEFDSFPIVWPLVVRVACAIGLGSDGALRGIGLIMGLALVATLWRLAWTFRTGPPLIALALLAICPSVIIWGDCVRGHGCGMVTGLMAIALIWRFVETAEAGSWVSAATVSLLAVQTSYYNSILVLAGGLGALAVCLRRKRGSQSIIALGIGVPAALSILPYLPVFRRAAEWNVLIQTPEYNFQLFWERLSFALADAGPWTIWLWAGIFSATLFLGLTGLISLPDWKPSPRARDVILFNLIVVVVGALAYYGFLKTLHYVTQAWYYLLLLAIIAAAVDAILGASCINLPARVVRSALAVVIFACLVPGTYRALPFRLTNIDLAAAQLKNLAGPSDLVVIDPWFDGITYARYNASAAPWITLPAMEFHRYHRYDLIKAMMQDPDQADPVRPVIESVRETLRAKNRVYFVGGIMTPGPNARPALFSPAPQMPFGWDSDAYRQSWTLEVGYFLQLHALSARALKPVTEERINRFENAPIVVIEGWKD